MIYLDNAATTQMAPEVLEAMMPHLRDSYGNPGSAHSFGRLAKQAVDDARESVARFLGCSPEQVVFTAGGSEANSLAITGVARRLYEFEKTHVICSQMEHKSVLNAVFSLTKHGFHTTVLQGGESGAVEDHHLKSVLRDNTGLVAVMHTNNETGVPNSIERISSLCHEKGLQLHVDCVQAAGFSDLNMSGLEMVGVTSASISSHKLHGPKGVGALFVRNKRIVDPLVFGGAEQEFGLRGGTENVAGLVGFGRACELALQTMKDDANRISLIRQRFYTTLRERLGDYQDILHVNGASPMDRSKIINIRFDGVDAETLLLVLDNKQIFVSAGSACNSYESEPSYVLLSIGLTPEQARGSIRVSFSRQTTEEEAVTAAIEMADYVVALKRLRE